MDVVKERTTIYVTVTFYNKAKVPEAPTAILYSVHDRDSGTELVATTAFSPPAAQVEIALGADANAIISAQRREEIHVLTVLASYGANDKCNAEYEYRVANLRFVATAALKSVSDSGGGLDAIVLIPGP